MKKIIYSLALLLIPFISQAQTYSLQDKTNINARIDTLLQSYLQKSGLTLPGGNKRNDKVVADLRTMIKTDAEVFDDINAVFNEKTMQYELKSKSRNSYIEDLVDAFPHGLLINNKNLNISYNDFDKGEVKVVLERNIQGTNAQKFTFFNEDTLLITIGILPDQTVKITNVSKIGSNIKCKNDDDEDGVIDELDECRKNKGLIALNGCPDNDGDGIANRKDDCPDLAGPESNGGCPPSTFAYQYVFSAGAGYQLNKNIIKAQEGRIGYPGYESELSSKPPVIESPGFKGSITVNANIAYYFGRNKNNRNKGISLGFYATNYKDSYIIKDVKYVFRGTQNGEDYRRIITLKEGHEDLSFSILNFPLLLKFKTKLGAKWAGEIGVGPSLLSIISTLKTTSSATFDFEGYYSDEDWAIIAANIDNDLFTDSLSTSNYFESLSNAGYDFGLNKTTSPDTKTFTKLKLAYNAAADLFYHIGPKTALRAGVTITYSPSTQKNSNYEMINATTDKYKSVYDSNIKSTYTSFGFNIGIIIGI